MAPKANWIRINIDQQAELTRLANCPGWTILPTSQLSGVLPPTLIPKVDSVMVVAERTSTGGTYLMLNALRIDGAKVDQQPFGLIVSSSGASSSGVWVNHGRWSGRTSDPPTGFWEHVAQSGIGGYFCANPPANARAGTLAQLSGGHRGAFSKIMDLLRKRKDSRRTG
jgi:hypothetical protein